MEEKKAEVVEVVENLTNDEILKIRHILKNFPNETALKIERAIPLEENKLLDEMKILKDYVLKNQPTEKPVEIKKKGFKI